MCSSDLLYPFTGEHKNFDAMAVYQQAFPAAFRPTPDTDRRLSGGYVTNGHYETNRFGGINTPIKVKYTGQGYVGLCWAYAFYRRQGDYFGRKELWPDEVTLTSSELAARENKTKTELNVQDFDKMHQERAAIFRNNDLRGNTMSAFYVINTVDKGMIQKGQMEPYVFPMLKGQPAYQGWALGYGLSGSIFAWASPYEDILKKDIPDLLKECDMSAIAYDGFCDFDTPNPIGLSEVYRGTTKYYLPGWSYDKDGKYIRQSIMLQRHADFFHSQKKNGMTLGLWTNGWWTNTLIAFKPDAYLYENFDQNSNSGVLYDRLKRGLYFRGHRPAYMHNVDYDTQISRAIPWEKLSPEVIRLAYEDYLHEAITTFYQTNFLPVWELVLTQKDIFDEMPYLTELSERGFYPPCPSRGNESLERVRYGQGLDSLLVISNRDRAVKEITETIDNEYLGDFNVIPVSYRGDKKFAVELSGAKTLFRTTLEPQENLLVVVPAAVKFPTAGIKAETSMVHDAWQKIYTYEFSSPEETSGTLDIGEDPHFRLFSVIFNGKEMKNYHELHFSKGKNTLEITMRSNVIREPAEKLNAFDYGSALIVIDANAGEREKGTAQMLRDYLECGFGNQTARVTDHAVKPSGNIILAIDAAASVELDKNKNLRITAADPFALQQTVWQFLRLLDRTNPKVNVSFGKIMEKPGMRDKMRNGNQVPFVAEKTGRRIVWSTLMDDTEENRSTLAFGYVNKLEVPILPQAPALTGKLADPVWKKAAVIGDFTLLGSITPAKVKTEVRILRVRDDLYVGFKCFEPDMDAIIDRCTERDGLLWEGDDVELRLAPGIDAEDTSRYPFYGFMASPRGICGDFLHYPKKMSEKAAAVVIGPEWAKLQPGAAWNAEWQAKTSRGKGFWIAEMKIPLAAINGINREHIRVLFSRGEKPQNENSCWPVVPEGLFNNQTYFGTITFKK